MTVAMPPSPPKRAFADLPAMLYADPEGRIFDHPHYRTVAFSGASATPLEGHPWVALPEFSKLFYLPGCPPLGCDPVTGRVTVVREIKVRGAHIPCQAVAAFLEPGWVRTLLPAADYKAKSYTLPMWAYTAVGFGGGAYRVPAFRIEENARWDPRNYDDRDLVQAIARRKKKGRPGPLLAHLENCATHNHCFAAKNLFLGRWEAPLPVSRTCNAACLGCLSLQPSSSCEASHLRLSFRPSEGECVSLAVRHLESSPWAIVSFGQGCEGEPLTEYRLIAKVIKGIRRHTQAGTLNLNTNGSWPDRVEALVDAGLDSIRISLNSARPALYHAYYRPKGFSFEDVVGSLALCRRRGLYTMINYLVFPGVSDQPEEMASLTDLIRATGVSFVHLKNLCIDPPLYLEHMAPAMGGTVHASPGIGLHVLTSHLKDTFPELKLGYFNQAIRP